jgi:RNA polymerase sigma-70 factor (ECF subfamily)
MKRINLRTYYSFINPHDIYFDVSDEVVILLEQFNKNEHAYNERRRRHGAYYSLDKDDGIDREIMLIVLSPQEVYEKKLERETLYSAILNLSEKQMKRIYAHFFIGMSISSIAHIECLDESSVRSSINNALKHLKKILKDFYNQPRK